MALGESAQFGPQMKVNARALHPSKNSASQAPVDVQKECSRLSVSPVDRLKERTVPDNVLALNQGMFDPALLRLEEEAESRACLQ